MDAETPRAPIKWWHWLLLYPALVTALLGALPTAWQAFRAWRLDVSYARVQIAEAQQKLWEKNIDCLSAKPVYSIDLPEGVMVGVTLCPSGDALLRYESQWGTVSYTWIPFPKGVQQRQASGARHLGERLKDEGGRRNRTTRKNWTQIIPVPPSSFILPPSSFSLRLTPSAFRLASAAFEGVPDAEPLVRSRILFGVTRCARLRQRKAVRLYSTDGSACFLEQIQVSTGQVLSRVPVPCTMSCPK